MDKKQGIEILQNMFRGGHGVLPLDLTYNECCKLIDLELEGLGHGRGPQEGSTGRPRALDILHRRLCKIKREEEYEAILGGDKTWHLNYSAPKKD